MGVFKHFFNGIKGKTGESKIAMKLDFIDFFGYDGKCLRNLYVPKEQGNTSEIDLLYITVKGIFVIESKNYSGYIFGNDSNRYWTSTLYAGRNWYGGKKVDKFHFYNPVWQNNSHIRTLKSYLGDVHAHSIIVFGDNCKLKGVSITTPGIHLCQARHLNNTIKFIWNSESDVYSKSQVEDIYNRLLPLTKADMQVKTKHIRDIKSESESDVCPRCGGKLVLRTAQRGAYQGKQFYGCSNYPRCKYIRNI